VVLSLLLGWLFFQEQLGVQRLAGMAVVVLAAIGAIALAGRKRPD
jgi:drug/metabolite transporter (DMT)-like permease